MSEGDQPVKAQPRELNQAPARLRRRRIAAGLSLRQAAAKAGCAYQHLSQLERGNHSAQPATLASLAEAYGCAISDLMPPERNGAAALWAG